MKKVKKICFFSAHYLPEKGGVEKYTYNLASKLSSRGYEITVAALNVKKEKCIEKTPQASIYRFPCFNLLNGRYPIMKIGRQSGKIKKELKKQKFDFIIINTRFYLHSLFGTRFAKKNKIPCIVIEHGSSHLTVNNYFLDRLGALFEHFITFLLCKYCKDFYAVSKSAGDWSGHFGIKSKGELYNAVNFTELTELINNPVCDYRSEYGISKQDTLVVFTGRLVKEKGIYQLVSAVEKVDSDRIKLIVAGDGPEYEKLLSKNYKNTFFTGEVDSEHIASLLYAADIFCLPSESEGMPTSVLEAAAAKCYIIATDCGSIREILGENAKSLLKDNSEESIISAIKETDKNSEEYLQTVNKVYKRVSDNFTFEKTADALERIFDCL